MQKLSFLKFLNVIYFLLFHSIIVLSNEFPYLYRSAYFLGRGDTGIAKADNENAIFYNPAGLSQGTGIYKVIVLAAPMIEISKDTRDVAKQISYQGNDPAETLRQHIGTPQHLGVNAFSGIILRRAALGAFAHSSSTAIIYKDHENGSLETVQAESVSDAGGVFSLAQNFGKSFHVGFTAKYFIRNQTFFKANATEGDQLESISDSSTFTMSGSGFGIDLGLMHQGKGRTPFSYGLTIQDLGNTIISPDTPSKLSKSERPLKDIQQTVNVGLALEPGTKFSKLKLLADFRDILDTTKQSIYKKIHLGSELSLGEIIGFTAGLNQGYPCFGAYLNVWLARLDLGSYTEEIGEKAGSRADIRYFIKFHMGL